MKTVLRTTAIVLAIAASTQVVLATLENEMTTEEIAQLETNILELLAKKTSLQAQGADLSDDEKRKLVESIKVYSNQLRTGEADEPGI